MTNSFRIGEKMNREKEKERLVELIKYYAKMMCINDPVTPDGLAEYLLSQGGIMPPCKVGDTVYSIGWFDATVKEEKILYWTYNSRLDNFVFGTDMGHFDANQIGKFIFLTRQAAEQALKESETK